MAGTGPDQFLEIPDSDPERSFTLEDRKRVTQNLDQVLREIHAGNLNDRPLTVTLLSDVHRAIFRDVRDHAGKHRSKHFGQEYLSFGPNRSEHRAKVPDALEQLFRRAEAAVRSLRDVQASADYDLRAIEVALQAHADLIRIHPFEDGNGRTSRAILSLLLVRLGLRPIPIETPKDEYNDCLNRYFRSGDLQPLVDLCLQLYPLR